MLRRRCFGVVPDRHKCNRERFSQSGIVHIVPQVSRRRRLGIIFLSRRPETRLRTSSRRNVRTVNRRTETLLLYSHYFYFSPAAMWFVLNPSKTDFPKHCQFLENYIYTPTWIDERHRRADVLTRNVAHSFILSKR